MFEPTHVLVPLVGRSREAAAIEYALETFPEAELTVLAVSTPLDSAMSEGGVLERDDERRTEARNRARSLLEVSTEALERAGSDVQGDVDAAIDVEEGRPGAVVPRYVSDSDVDHVVMCGSDSSGLVRRLLGRDVSTTVVERTDVPVTVLE
ncbi:universal stress protein [Natrialbaceae archaeon A-CW3]